MIKSSNIKQGWIHIYDSVDKNSSRRFRHVHDLLTEKDYHEIDFKGTDYSSLKIMGRNVNSELAYFEHDGTVRVSIGPMGRWPKLPKPKSFYEEKLKHVRIDIGYNPLENHFEKNIFRGYKSLSYFTHKLYLEFHIYIANGLKIKENNCFIDINFEDSENKITTYKFTNNRSLKNRIYEKITKFYNKKIRKIDSKENSKVLIFQNDSFENKYSIIINPKYYNQIDESIDYANLEVVLRYEVVNHKRFFIVVLLSILVTILSAIEILSPNIMGVPFIAFISTGALYLGLLNQNYEIPLERIVLLSLSIALVFSLIKSFKVLYPIS